MNQAYADSFIISSLCSVSYGETLVKEIKALDRCAVVNIDIPSKSLQYSYIDYEENTLELNSAKGLRVLDGWYEKWVKLIAHLYLRFVVQIEISSNADAR